jgi:hypothetical protein
MRTNPSVNLHENENVGSETMPKHMNYVMLQWRRCIRTRLLPGISQDRSD